MGSCASPNKGVPASITAKAFEIYKRVITSGFSPSTLCRWVKKYHSGTSHPKKRTRTSIISQIENTVADYITNNPFDRLIDIVHHLRERDICISKSTVYRILRKEKFTRKRASAKYCPKLPTREEATAYLSALRSEKQVISIDESSIYLESRVRAAVQQVTKSRRPPRSRRRSRRTRGRRRRRRRRWGRGRAFSRPRS